MVFYNNSLDMQKKLEKALMELSQEIDSDLKDFLSVSWLSYPNGLENKPDGTSWAAQRLFYPADLVSLFYAVAIEIWLQRQWLEEDIELQRAMNEMAFMASRDATSMVIDYLTGTASGPKIHNQSKYNWYEQRQLLNNWLSELDWPELIGVNVSQKLLSEGAFGRERQSCGIHYQNRNRLSTGAMIRLLHIIVSNSLPLLITYQRIQYLFKLNFDINIDSSESQSMSIWRTSKRGNSSYIDKVVFNEVTYHKIIMARTKDQVPNIIVIFNENSKVFRDDYTVPTLINRLITD
uniref:Uncharacterized protein n=1 Tax=Paulinella longichromatophora TaxID=1708747 RepID=A0A2H4ZPT0_9EUKA|nr:hypothetical protein PLO_556 [Paulinella longichromatophora]